MDAKYFNDEAKAKVEERKKLWSPEFDERVTREWNELFHAMYADGSNWPPEQRQHQIKPEIQAFILKAMKASPTA